MTSADDFATHAHSLAIRAIVLARRGKLQEAEQLAREAISITAATDSFGQHAQMLVALADVLELAGRPEETAQVLREAVDHYERKGALAAAQSVRERIAATQPTKA